MVIGGCEVVRAERDELTKQLEKRADDLSALQEEYRRLQSEFDLEQVRRDHDGPLNAATTDPERERRTGTPLFPRVVSDDIDAEAEPLPIAELPSADRDDAAVGELDDVRCQLEKLGQRLEQSERLNREMAAILGGMGILYRPIRV